MPKISYYLLLFCGCEYKVQKVVVYLQFILPLLYTVTDNKPHAHPESPAWVQFRTHTCRAQCLNRRISHNDL